ncbi:MAG: hypothetical protein RLW62_09915 [Gammaproteobacteria bacterium]
MHFPHICRTVYAAALAGAMTLALASCGSERAPEVAATCSDTACLRDDGYVCEIMATGFHHCTCGSADCAAVDEYICMNANCVVKPFEGPVTGALLESLDPAIYAADAQGS